MGILFSCPYELEENYISNVTSASVDNFKSITNQSQEGWKTWCMLMKKDGRQIALLKLIEESNVINIILAV